MRLRLFAACAGWCGQDRSLQDTVSHDGAVTAQPAAAGGTDIVRAGRQQRNRWRRRLPPQQPPGSGTFASQVEEAPRPPHSGVTGSAQAVKRARPSRATTAEKGPERYRAASP